jgi:hypothetical protein
MYDITIRTAAQVILFSLLSSPANAYNGGVVYRWLDENNVLHFSQVAPATIDTETVSVELAYQPPEKKQTMEPSEVAQSQTNEMTKTEKLKQCLLAENNLTILSENKNISFTDLVGVKHLLTEKEKVEHLATSKKLIKMYCDKQV